ncbi:hypothetical protein V8F33_001977 [Rhypophila sp. PSN 637]
MPPNPSALKSFEWFRYNNNYPRCTLFINRLRWDPFTLPDIEKSVAVIEDPIDAYSRQTGYSPTHPIADQPATDPPVSSMRVVTHDITLWDYHWLKKHREHLKNPSKVRWRDHDPDDDKPRGRCGTRKPRGKKVIGCCNQDAPPNYYDSPDGELNYEIWATNRPYVTVNDYITGVNNYIQTHRAQILAAKGEADHLDGPFPVGPTRRLYLWPAGGLDYLSFFEENEFYRANDLDWESLANICRSEVEKITINYLYNTFPPELPTRTYHTATYTRRKDQWSEPTTRVEVSWGAAIKGSSRKAMDMHVFEFMFGPPKPEPERGSAQTIIDRLTRRFPLSPSPSMYTYTRDYSLTREAWVARFGDGVTCPAWRLDLLRGIGG